MKANELRIGNWVKRDTQPDGFQIDCMSFTYCEKYNDWYEPIPLTEEWLNKEPERVKEWKGNGADYQPETSKTKQVFYYLSEDVYLVFETWSYRKTEDDEWVDEYSCFISFHDSSIFLTKQEVHILQNLYFALTGNELEIK